MNTRSNRSKSGAGALAVLAAAVATVSLFGGNGAAAQAVAAPLGAASAASSNAAAAVPEDKIKDLTATLVVQEVDRAELRKIGGAFATTYSLKRLNVAYQYPNKARFDAQLLGAKVFIVYNGDDKMFHTPVKSGKLNVYGQAGQKQSLIDLGIFARDYLATDYEHTFQRMEKGRAVYKLTQRNSDNRSYEIIWVDPKTSIIERHQSYNGDGKFVKEIRFVQPVQIRPGIWVPKRLEIYNAEGKLGVAQSIENVKVNLGVDASQFTIS